MARASRPTRDGQCVALVVVYLRQQPMVPASPDPFPQRDCKVPYREHVSPDVTACILLTEGKVRHRQRALCRATNGRWCVKGGDYLPANISGIAGVLPHCFPDLIPGSSASKKYPSCRDI
jgi:hypothetical protein